ncbi:2385_t:CDS:1, partial [Dentiscutata erythropus]
IAKHFAYKIITTIMKNIFISALAFAILSLAILSLAFAKPTPRIMVGTLFKRSGLVERQDNTTCLCPPTNVPCDSQNLCPATACEADDPPCGSGCCEQGSICSSNANGP